MKISISVAPFLSVFLLIYRGNADKSPQVQNSFLEALRKNTSLVLRPSSCAELLLAGQKKSGVYTIYPRVWYRRNPLKVYCDMETDCGGWTVFQRRDDYDAQEDFFRDWMDYQQGFGSLERDFWLGNDNLYVLTNQDHVSLRVDMEDKNGDKRYAVYEIFEIADCDDHYKVRFEKYSGTAGNTFINASTAAFVTYDKGDVHNCAKRFRGGWWYTNCHTSNLNGLYSRESTSTDADKVCWHAFNQFNPLKRSEMKIRQTKFFSCGT